MHKITKPISIKFDNESGRKCWFENTGTHKYNETLNSYDDKWNKLKATINFTHHIYIINI